MMQSAISKLSIFNGSEDLAFSFDIGIIIFIFIAAFFWSLQAGKQRILLFILSIYGSIALVSFLPVINEIILRFPGLSAQDASWISMALFVFFIAVFYYVLSGSRLKLSLPLPRRSKKDNLVHIFILSISAAGLFAGITLALLGNVFAQYISQLTESIFLTNGSQIFWMIAPLLVIFITAKYRKE